MPPPRGTAPSPATDPHGRDPHGHDPQVLPAAPDPGRDDPAGLSAPERDTLRRLRAAGRDAIRDAREAAKDASRQSRESLRETVRQVREAEREAVRQLRARREAADRGEADTRTRIQRIALELFTEHGYEATSLREIAERLGVTKAALYYHFKTKDEIIESFVADRVANIDELIAWAKDQPRTPQTRREFLQRYSDMLHAHGHHALMKFFERNQSSMTQHKAGVQMREKMYQMLDLLCPPGAPLTEQIRCSLAIFALHSTWFTVRDPDVSEDQRRAAALSVANDLVGVGD